MRGEAPPPKKKKIFYPTKFFFTFLIKSKIRKWVIKFDSPLLKCPLEASRGVTASFRYSFVLNQRLRPLEASRGT